MRFRNRYVDAGARIALELSLLIVPLFLLKKFVLKPALALLPLSATVTSTIQGLVTSGMLFGAYALIVRSFERRAVDELSATRAGREALLGVVASFATISAIVGSLWLLGAYSAAGFAFSAHLIRTTVWIFSLALLEELMFRGIAYRILERYFGTLSALAVSAAIFGGLHITNENATLLSVVSAALGGLFVALFYTLTGRLWLPIFFHFGWNMGQIFWGTPMSGMEEFGKFFDGRLRGPEWLTGGAFGPENSVITLAVCVALLVGSFALARRRGRIVPLARRGVPDAMPRGG